MSAFQRQLALAVAFLLLAAAATWWWFDTFEKGWEAFPNTSTASRDNPMLAATRLLQLHKHAVTAEATLGEALLKPLPPGAMVLPETNGVITAAQAKNLLTWVAQGNILITRPKWASVTSRSDDTDDDDSEGDEDESDADDAGDESEKSKSSDVSETNDASNGINAGKKLNEADPVGAHVGVVLIPEPGNKTKPTAVPPEVPAATPTDKAAVKKPPSRVVGIVIPGRSYPLQVQADFASLRSKNGAATPLYADDDGVAIRIYKEGNGYIVMIANNAFDNRRLATYDHAELLLALVQLRQISNGSKNHVLLVQRLAILPWYQALWTSFHLAIISLGCGLLLLFWVAIRRFGPMLPEPNLERRSLMEHIDASGRWLWKVPGGRDILLGAARAATLRILQRRAPELMHVGPAEQGRILAQACSLSRSNIASALHQPASSKPVDFTRQIQTLQQLRKHYER